MFYILAKEEDKKDATTSSNSSSSVLNLAAMGSHGREKRQHSGVSETCFDIISERTRRCGRDGCLTVECGLQRDGSGR